MSSTRSSLREGLRQAPKANQPFIPDTAPVRQSRSITQMSTTSNHTIPSGHTPISHAAGVDSSNIMSPNFDIDQFEGKDVKQVPMSTRDVLTPGNKPELFNRKTDSEQPDFYHPYYPLKSLQVPRHDDIYKRVLMSVQCGIPDEVDWALFHLVQMSDKIDRYFFEGFPMLMETLMEKAMEITQLCTGVKWELERDIYRFPAKMHRPNVLSTLYGTKDLLDRIKQIPVTLPPDALEDDEYAHHLKNIKDASLVLRNMCSNPANAKHISSYARGLLRDYLVIMLNLPQPPRFNELKNDALDIATCVTMHLPTIPDDPLCISLYRCLKSDDRAHILGALWSITHFSAELLSQDVRNLAMDFPIDQDLMTRLIGFLNVRGDEDLVSGTLDFWYQYTLDDKNVEHLIEMVNLPIVFVPILLSLLLFNSREAVEETIVQEEKLAPTPSSIPKVPPELLKKLMTLPEPSRSSQWLRCCFVEDPDCEITQIALWQAYQYRFGSPQPGNNPQQPNNGALAAADFIKNVSQTFHHAQAQVVPASVTGTQPKFIIRGIRPLDTALTFEGWPYLYCEWSVGDQPGHYCDRAFAEPLELRRHVFVDHMDLDALDEPNQYNMDRAKKSPKGCRWNRCTKYKTPSSETEMVVEHVGGHLPQDRPAGVAPSPAKRRILQPRISRSHNHYDTPLDHNGEPYGVAYKAALVLRNLAKNLPDTSSERSRGVPWKQYVFGSHKWALIDKFDANRSLRGPLTDVINLAYTPDVL